MLGGVAIDAAFYGDFSPATLAGGCCALAGLTINALMDARDGKKAHPDGSQAHTGSIRERRRS